MITSPPFLRRSLLQPCLLSFRHFWTVAADQVPSRSQDSAILIERGRCYSLPYGALGFISHSVTYYVILALCLGLRPWQPWRRNKYAYFNIFLAVTAFVPSFVLSSIAIARCRHCWQYALIASSRMILSLILGLLSLRAAITGCRKPQVLARRLDTLEPTSMLFWLCLSVMGMLLACIGTVSLVSRTISTFHDVLFVTTVFAAVAFVVVLLCVASICWKLRSKYQYDENRWATEFLGYHFVNSTFFRGVLICTVLVAVVGLLIDLWSDWVLGAIRQAFSGDPLHQNAALYWCYFAFEMLPFFFS